MKFFKLSISAPGTSPENGQVKKSGRGVTRIYTC